MTDTEQLAQIVIRLDAMTPRFHAPADGLGKHLGDGLPHQGASLRTVVLANAIRELIAARSRIVALEKALLDADSWVQTGEGVVLEYYHEGFGDDDSVAVIEGLRPNK